MNVFIHPDLVGYYHYMRKFNQSRNQHRIADVVDGTFYWLGVANEVDYNRHLGRANVLFLDGHVAPHTKGSLRDVGAWVTRWGIEYIRPGGWLSVGW